MKRIPPFILIVGILLSYLSSCKKENSCDCIKSTGTIVGETRNVPKFTRLLIENDVNVFIKQDSVFNVQVSAGKNLMGLVKTEVRDGELTIMNSNKCNFMRSYEPKINVYISMPVILYVKHNGTGLVKSVNTITTSEFDIWTQSSGDIIMDVNNNKMHTHLQRNSDITLTGRCNELTCYCDHSGMLHAEKLIAEEYVWFVNKSTSDSHFFITQGLINITLLGVGNIYYSGNATSILLHEENKGRLIKQ